MPKEKSNNKSSSPYAKPKLVPKPIEKVTHSIICYHGLLCDRKESKNNGPFFKCRNGFWDNENKKYDNGCKFFLWEKDVGEDGQLLCPCKLPYKTNFWETDEKKREYFCAKNNPNCLTLVPEQ